MEEKKGLSASTLQENSTEINFSLEDNLKTIRTPFLGSSAIFKIYIFLNI